MPNHWIEKARREEFIGTTPEPWFDYSGTLTVYNGGSTSTTVYPSTTTTISP